MIPYVRKSFYKHYIAGLEYIEGMEKESIKSLFEKINILETSIEDTSIYNYTKSYKYAMDMTKKEIYQAAEGLYHNLNTLQSRSGNQLPFTSINYGTCTLTEGRMVTEALLNALDSGTGKFHRTSIFPCGIFKCKKGVNREPDSPNYDLFKRALEVTSRRLYPNYANVDWTGNEGYDPNDPKTEFSTMGM